MLSRRTYNPRFTFPCPLMTSQNETHLQARDTSIHPGMRSSNLHRHPEEENMFMLSTCWREGQRRQLYLLLSTWQNLEDEMTSWLVLFRIENPRLSIAGGSIRMNIQKLICTWRVYRMGLTAYPAVTLHVPAPRSMNRRMNGWRKLHMMSHRWGLCHYRAEWSYRAGHTFLPPLTPPWNTEWQGGTQEGTHQLVGNHRWPDRMKAAWQNSKNSL